MTTLEAGHAVETPRRRPVYTRVQVLGLLLIGTATFAVAVLAAVVEPEALIFFGIISVATLLAAALAWRFGTWARLLGIVVSAAAAFMLFWAVFGLSYPQSFVDFALGVAVPLGALLGVGGGIAALVRGRRESASTQVESRLVRGTLIVVVLALAASAVLTVLNRTAVDPAVAAGSTEVEMVAFAFEPLEIRTSASDPRLTVKNADPFMHDIAVPALDVLVNVTPGSTVTVDLSGAAPGTYMVYCTLHSNTSIDDPAEAGMAARLIIE